MKYIRPRLPEKEIELCLELFDKNEAKKRILRYIKDMFDHAESQFADVVSDLEIETAAVNAYKGKNLNEQRANTDKILAFENGAKWALKNIS